MANTVTVWVRLRQPTLIEPDRILSESLKSLPLILRMRSSVPSEETDFTFPYSPREINIGRLSDEMVQIPRPGTTPIVAFKSHNLMTLDFTALITVPGDGLVQGIDEQIFALRQMASRSDRVFQLINYDVFTNTPFIFRNMSEERVSGLFFSITEMSVDVTRRNVNNNITSANVKISLIENRNPKINIVSIPPLKFVRNFKDKSFTRIKKTDKFPLASHEADTVAAKNIVNQKGKLGVLVTQIDGTKKYVKPGEPGYPK